MDLVAEIEEIVDWMAELSNKVKKLEEAQASTTIRLPQICSLSTGDLNGDTQKVQRALEEYIKKVQPGQYRLHFDAANGEAVGKAVSAWGYNAELGGPKITRLVGDLALSGNTQALSDAYRRLAIDVINATKAAEDLDQD